MRRRKTVPKQASYNSLAAAVRSMLNRMQDSAYYARGERYFEEERVGGLARLKDTITADAYGTWTYNVQLSLEDGLLQYFCECPVGQEGEFCKHCVAVALAWLEQGEDVPSVPEPPVPTLDDVAVHLGGLKKEELVNLIMELALRDEHLRERLLLQTMTAKAGDCHTAVFRRLIDRAVHHGGFVDYSSAYDYARRVEEMVETLADLVNRHDQLEVIELIEHAVAAVEKALGSVDDSDGEVGSLLTRLQELHLTACKKVRPDPEALAERLFEWELNGDFDVFYGAAETYAEILGPKGLAAYRKRAEAIWATVPTVSPGDRDDTYYSHRFRVEAIMEALVRQTGDLEELVAVKSRNLSSAYRFLGIAEIYKKARKYNKALEWAERGREAFPGDTDSRLIEFLAEEYHRRRRHDEAMELVWSRFVHRPELSEYQNLEKHADRVGKWPEWREKALNHIRGAIARSKKEAKKRPYYSARTDHSVLVQIFLWEKDLAAAWAEAQAGGCAAHLWRELADKWGEDHAGDVIDVYKRLIADTLKHTGNSVYEDAVRLLKRVNSAMKRSGRAGEFETYLQSIRREQKRKRNLMKLLDRARWSNA